MMPWVSIDIHALRASQRMKMVLMMGLSILLSSVAFGTQQIPDKIIYEGKNYALRVDHQLLPMEKYFLKHPDKKPRTRSMSTNLRRGHLATLEIKDGQLHLADMQLPVLTKQDDERQREWKSVLRDIFPNQEEVKMDWVTGLLVVSREGSDASAVFILEIDKGKVMKEKTYDYKKDGGPVQDFMTRQLEAFKKTDEYEAKKAELQKIQTPYVIDWLMRSEIPKILVD